MNRILFPILIMVLSILSLSLEIVQEGFNGIKLHFNQVSKDKNNNVIIYSPGMHFKIPFIESLKKLDSKIQTLMSTSDRFVSVEKKDLLVDSYVKWKVVDFSKFYTSTGGGDYTRANDLLKRKVNDRLRSEIGSRTIKDIVSGTRGELMEDAKNSLNDASVADMGITVVDVRIKKINLPDEVSSAIFDRMKAERNTVATAHRAQGEQAAEYIRAKTNREVAVIMANANKEAQDLKAEGDRTAAKLYNDAFNNEEDFYTFIKSLKAYEQSFNKSNNMLILKPDSEFLRYMKSPN